MPRELIAVQARKPVLRAYEDRRPDEGEVLVRTEFSSVKHGTEMGLYHGDAEWVRGEFDPKMRIFLAGKDKSIFPMPLGNMAVGVVEEVGPGVSGLRKGSRVFGHMPARDSHTIGATRLRKLPRRMRPRDVVCVDPAEFALGAVRDGHIRLGDRVGVFGCGAIGLVAVQLARLQGAEPVFAIDPVKRRREIAIELGADQAFDPAGQDVGLEIKKATGGAGIDVAIDYSGAPAALYAAIRALTYEGLLVAGGVYKPATPELQLGTEFHWNRITIVSSRACSEPNPEYPRWTTARIVDTAFRLLQERKIQTEPIVQPILPFSRAARAYAGIDKRPDKYIKLSFTHDRARG